MSLLPIMRPKLPGAAALAPYLEKIDATRTYSNYGPLNDRLEQRLAGHYGAPVGSVVTVANGTLGLALALMAQDARPGTLCVMPAWTFIATPQAAVIAGLVPYFVDVDPATWALNPAAMDEVIRSAPGEVGAIMPVVPFGRPIDFAAWSELYRRLRLPIVIDAAAAFDSTVATGVPTIVSLHATKSLGAGEGGFLLCEDAGLITEVRRRANFGFIGSRESLVPSFNAKLSEYHAAVGLASLDEWPQARSEWLLAASRYRDLLRPYEAAKLQPGQGEDWVSSVCVLDLLAPQAEAVEARLSASGIETRRWWGLGAHTHPSTQPYPRTDLSNTDLIARSTIAVPLYRDITASQQERVIESLLQATSTK